MPLKSRFALLALSAALPLAALAQPTSGAYQAGFKVGQFIGRGLPWAGGALLVVLVVWLVARSRGKRPR